MDPKTMPNLSKKISLLTLERKTNIQTKHNNRKIVITRFTQFDCYGSCRTQIQSKLLSGKRVSKTRPSLYNDILTLPIDLSNMVPA